MEVQPSRLQVLSGQVTATPSRKVVAGEIPGLIGCQQQDSPRDILWLSNPTQRRLPFF